MKLKAGFATTLKASRSERSDSVRAAVTLSSSHESKGSSALSATTRRAKLAVVVAAVIVAVPLVTSGSAHATTGHGFAGSFGGAGAADGQFSPAPRGVGVGLSGEVFADSDSRIQRFDAGGMFQSALSIEGFEVDESHSLAVDSALAGGVYAPGRNLGTGVPGVWKYSSAGAFEYVLNEAGSETAINIGVVAVDPSNGTVYTTATSTSELAQGAQVIDSFNQATGAFIASFDGSSGSPDGGLICPSGLAVDPTHHVYILDPCKGRVDRYSTAGAYEATVDNGSRGAVQMIATNPQTGELYVAEAGRSGLQITNFAAGGSSGVATFPATHDEGLSAMAVGPDGTVYTADSANSVIDRFTPFEGPTVATEPATEVQTRTATLNGTVNAEGKASKYHYEYGLETTYGSSTPVLDAGSGKTATPAPGPVEGLVPNTTYHYRVVGSNASGSILGEDQTLTTVAAPPTVDGSPAFASAITPTGARVHATVDPQHSLTTFRIEYGTTTAYGSTAPEGGSEVGEQSVDTPVAATLTGLQPGTLYHYRVSAEDGIEGAQTGADGTFVTAPAAPAGATELTTRRATLTGTIDPHGAATTYRFNYGPSAAYGASTPERDGGSGEGEQAVSAPIGGLSPSTTYHVQVVASTNGVTYSGADGTFTTPPAPEATISEPTVLTTSSATLKGAVNTNGLAGSFHFEVLATDGSYSSNTEEQSLPAGSGSRPVSVPIGGLPPGESFQGRLIVTSNEATGFSEPVSFNTAPLPPRGFSVPSAPASVYGCSAPHLNPVNGTVKPGSTITVSGSDLGLTGSVLLGESTPVPTGWSPSGFSVEVPAGAIGTLGLTVNCGTASNTVAVVTTGAVDNSFAVVKHTVKGSTATFTVELPGPGALQSSSARTRSTAQKVTGAGAQTVEVTLSKAGAKVLRKAKKQKLTVRVALRFTPSGGSAASHTASATFTRRGR